MNKYATGKDFIYDFLKRNYPLPVTSVESLVEIGETIFAEKGTILFTAGKKNTFEYFIAEGFCRSFVLNPEAEEITLSFFKSPGALSPHITRAKQNTSLVHVQALTDVTVIRFSAQAFLELMISDLEIRNLGNSILLQELISKTEKEISMATMTAKERLVKFRIEYGILENLVPHPVIASYLGITNVSLSRLRGEVK